MFLPRASIRVLDEENDDGRNTLYFAELVTALGPQQIAQTGDNSYPVLFGAQYVLELRRDDNRLHLYRRTGTGWLDVTSSLPSGLQVDMSEDVRRITLAFDQSARPIVAFEENGSVKVTRWDTQENAYLQNVTFPGKDPSLLMDATLVDSFPPNVQAWFDAGGDVRLVFHNGTETNAPNIIAQSDVLLFYLRSSAPGKVFYRIQNQNYGTENELTEHPDIAILDRAHALMNRFQLLVSDATGTPLGQISSVDALASEPYIDAFILRAPVLEPLAVPISAPQNAWYRPVVIIQEGGDEASAEIGAPQSAWYQSIVIIEEYGDDMTAAISAPEDAWYRPVVIIQEGGDDMTAAISAPESAAYPLVVIVHEANDDMTAAISAPQGGSYDAV